MILDVLERWPLYAAPDSHLGRGLRFLADFDPATGDGRYELDGDSLFALVQRYDTSPGADKRFESHRRYVDIQFVASGRERILHAPAAGLEVDQPYDASTDVAFYRDPPASSSMLLSAGDFAILYPDDAHKPGCMAGGREPIVKVVVKVRS